MVGNLFLPAKLLRWGHIRTGNRYRTARPFPPHPSGVPSASSDSPGAFRRLESVLQVRANHKHLAVLYLYAARHRFAQVSAQIRTVTAQRVPDEAVLLDEGVEVDPTALDPQSDRFGERVVHPEQCLVAEQRIGELGLCTACAPGKIPTDLIHIGQTGARCNRVDIGVPRPHTAVVDICIAWRRGHWRSGHIRCRERNIPILS